MPAPDPRKQDCFASYLYGAGYFARDENTLGILTGVLTTRRPNFCQTCPARTDCEARQRARVRSEQPEAMEAFDRTVKEARAAGFTYLLTELATAGCGVNPFYNDALENFKRGHADRGTLAGTLTHGRDENPDVR